LSALPVADDETSPLEPVSEDLATPVHPSLSVPHELPGPIDLSSYLESKTAPELTATTAGMQVAVVRGNHIAGVGYAGTLCCPSP